MVGQIQDYCHCHGYFSSDFKGSEDRQAIDLTHITFWKENYI